MNFVGNVYTGTWVFQAFAQAAGCPINWTGSALAWVRLIWQAQIRA